MNRILVVILLTLFLALFVSKSFADNIGLDYGFGPNQMPSYGVDYTKTYSILYIDPGIMLNSQMISPSISLGLQLETINVGLVASAVAQNSIVYGLGGAELGFTDNLNETFYLKENNQLLRDVNNMANFGITLSGGFNF